MITLFLLVSSLSLGQETGATSSVPRLISYSGIAKNGNGKPLTGPLGVTFALYKEEEGGAPIWLEAQSVQADATGHYTATLGATQSNGLPLEVFNNSEARWSGVQVEGPLSRMKSSGVQLLSWPTSIFLAHRNTDFFPDLNRSATFFRLTE